MLPLTIPIFPLPNVVLFPQVFLPLHIFEPRYREMIRDALGGDRLIGMVLLQPGWEDRYAGRPSVYPVGCAGLITHAERVPDGRYNIMLRGLHKFRILDEDERRIYRVARIEAIVEGVPDAEREPLHDARRRLEALVAASAERAGREAKIPPAMPDEDLIHALAQHLELEPIEKQALLEQTGLVARSRALIELLEMKLLAARQPWCSDGVH